MIDFDEVREAKLPPAVLTEMHEFQRWLYRHKGRELVQLLGPAALDYFREAWKTAFLTAKIAELLREER